MLRLLLSTALAFTVVCCGIQGAEKGERPANAKPKLRLRLPRNWDTLSLTEAQKEKLAEIQTEYEGRISAVDAEIKKLRRQYLQPFRPTSIRVGDREAMQKAYLEYEQARTNVSNHAQEKAKERRALIVKRQEEMEAVLSDAQKSKVKVMYVKENLVTTTQGIVPPALWRKLKPSDVQLEKVYPILKEHHPRLEEAKRLIAILDEQIALQNNQQRLDFNRESSAAAVAKLAKGIHIGQKLPGLEDQLCWSSKASTEMARWRSGYVKKLSKQKKEIEQRLVDEMKKMLSDIEQVLTDEQKGFLRSLESGKPHR